MRKYTLSASTNERLRQKKIEAGINTRGDLSMSDYVPLDDVSARVLITHSHVAPMPTNQEIVDWFEKKMGNAVRANLETVTEYPKHNAVSVVVSRRVERLPIAAANNMIRAGIDTYQDDDNAIWKVTRNEHGPYLIRDGGEPVERMLEIRKANLQGQRNGRNPLRFASVMDSIPSAGGGYARVGKGDLVDFFDRGLIHRGRVTSSTNSGVNIRVEGGSLDGKTLQVDPAAILTVREKALVEEQREDDLMRDYYKLLYPGNPEMTRTISPLSRKPVNDPRPLKVQNIKTVMGSAASPEGVVKKNSASRRVVRRVKGTRA